MVLTNISPEFLFMLSFSVALFQTKEITLHKVEAACDISSGTFKHWRLWYFYSNFKSRSKMKNIKTRKENVE